MGMSRTVVMAAAVLAACGAFANEDSAESILIVDGAMKMRFLPVDGTSQLPIEFMSTGENREKLSPVTMPKFWIADRMVTEGEYAAIMGCDVREGRKADDILAEVEWEEVLDFCEMFTKKYSAQMPTNTIASMPTMFEWAHAVKLADAKTKSNFKKDIGTYLFTCSKNGGFLQTFCDGSGRDFDLAVDFVTIPKRAKHPFVGLRMILVDVSGGQVYCDKNQIDNALVSRGVILTQYGLFEHAKRLLRHLLKDENLADNDLKRTKRALDFASEEHEYDYEDWSGIVAIGAKFAETNGYVSVPYASLWQWAGLREMEYAPIAKAYENAGVFGEWVHIGDLPYEVQLDQHVGGTNFMIVMVGESLESANVPISSNTLVQVLRCDFTGDGRSDMVVEQFGNVGSGGYWYGFYMQQPDGVYTNIYEVQTVGLCAFPKKDGGSVAFLNVGKESNPVLHLSLLAFNGAEHKWHDVRSSSFYMLDVDQDHIYMAAPFIGAGYGLGWSHLQSRGAWYRPIYWPWKAGMVQGLDEARKEAANKQRLTAEAMNQLAELRAKWPHAAGRVSMWDMPDYAKRFFEIDAFQDWCNEDKKARYGEFEKACRDAIELKIEPPIWYYNLACALAVQGKRDEAFDALEQAVVAGYNKAERAESDIDFDAISEDSRFAGLLRVMGLPGRRDWRYAKEPAKIVDDVVELTADNVYFAFNKHCYLADVEVDGTTFFYMDRDGKDDVALDGYVTVKYEDEAKKRCRHIGLANTVINKNPVVARGTFVPEQIRTDAFDAIAVSQQNVLGLYACESWTNKLDWCILYRGGEKEGRRLAEIVRIVYLDMSSDQVAAMLERGEFAREMTKRIHEIVKDGKDGAVIDVADIDVLKLASTNPWGQALRKFHF